MEQEKEAMREQAGGLLGSESPDADLEPPSGRYWQRKRGLLYALMAACALLGVAFFAGGVRGSAASLGLAGMDPDGLVVLDATAGELSNSQKVDILYYHNQFRCMHNALPVVWNPTVAWSAQKMVQRLGFHHSSGTGYGENLAWRSDGINPYKMVKSWYDEVKHTYGGRQSHFTGSTGHYTQLVWAGSKRIGCGKKGGTLNCEYSPAGNYRGRFSANVLGKKYSAKSCKGAGYSEYSRSYGTPKAGDKWQIKETCYCTDICGKGGKSYNWCHTKGCNHKGGWDYCTLPSNGSPKKKGCSCKSICDYGKRDKAWCYFYDQKSCGSKWGDCTPA